MRSEFGCRRGASQPHVWILVRVAGIQRPAIASTGHGSGAGRLCGVGRDLGVALGVPVGVGFGVGLPIGVGVAVGVGVTVGVGVPPGTRKAKTLLSAAT